MNFFKLFYLLSIFASALCAGFHIPCFAGESEAISKNDRLIASTIDGICNGKLDRKDIQKLKEITHSKDKELKANATLAECLCFLEFSEEPSLAIASAIAGVLDDGDCKRIQEYLKQAKEKKTPLDGKGKEILSQICKPGKWGKDNIPLFAASLFALSQLSLQVEAARAMDDLLRNSMGFDNIVSLYFAGDMKMFSSDYESAFSFYDLALRRIKYNPSIHKDTQADLRDGFKEAFARLIEHKRDEAKNLFDTQKLGFGYLLFKEAETARRVKSDFLTAFLVYDELLASPGNGLEPRPAKTAFGEAAKAYKIKCFLSLSRDNAAKDARTSLANLENNLETLKLLLKTTKKSGAGKGIQEKIESEIEKISARLMEAKKVPFGDEAAKQAIAELNQLISNQRPSPYKGELLLDLGDHLLERDLNIEEAAQRFQESSSFFDDAISWEAASDLLKMLPDALMESTPPITERQQDMWGNILSNEISPGQLFNQRTCSWYLSHFKKEVSLRMGFVSFFKGDFPAARNAWNELAKLDPFLNETEKMGFGSVRERLIWNIDHNNGCLYATPAEMKAFKDPKIRLAVMLADLAFENEDRKTAVKRYDELLSGNFCKLSKDELAYILFAKGVSLAWIKGSDAALKHLEENYVFIKGSPSEPRALLAMAGRSKALGTADAIAKSLQYCETLSRKFPSTEEGLDALFFAATTYRKLGQLYRSRKLFTEYISKKKNGGYVDFAKKYLSELESKDKDKS